MVFVEHYQERLARARLLYDRQLFLQAQNLAEGLYLETKELAHQYDQIPGLLMIARQLNDVAIQTQVLLLFIEQRQKKE